MIDYNFMITVYGEHFRHESIIEGLETGDKTAVFRKSAKNPRTAYFEPAANVGMLGFLQSTKQAIREIWHANAIAQMRVFAGLHHITLGENRLAGLRGKEALSRETARLALRAIETGLYDELKKTVPLLGWDTKPTTKNIYKNLLYGETKNLLELFGITGRIFHINIGYQYQCDFEMDEKIMVLIADMGLSFTFSCYEQEIETENQ